MNPYIKHQPIAKPSLTHDNATPINVDSHTYKEQGSNTPSQRLRISLFNLSHLLAQTVEIRRDIPRMKQVCSFQLVLLSATSVAVSREDYIHVQTVKILTKKFSSAHFTSTLLGPNFALSCVSSNPPSGFFY